MFLFTLKIEKHEAFQQRKRTPERGESGGQTEMRGWGGSGN